MDTLKFQIRIGLLMLAVCFLTAGTVVSQDRASLMGFAPAYLRDSLPEFAPPGNAPYTRYERLVTLSVAIDEKGAVTDVASDTSHSRYLGYVDGYVRTLQFRAAEREGQNVASTLPVRVRFQPRQQYPSFAFPVAMDGTVADRELFFDAARMNGFEPARLLSFPKYYAEMKWDDTTALYPFVMLVIDLDSTGTVTALDTVLSTLPRVNKTTASASLWADYEPARIDGKPVSSRAFLVVSYFPQTIYPSKRRPGDHRNDSLPPQERWRVQLLPDTVGYMVPPIPRRAPGDRLKPSGPIGIPGGGLVSAALAVDTTGDMRVVRSYGEGSSVAQVAGEMSRQIPFYPALDFAGNPLRMRGMAYLFGDSGSRNVRIVYHW